MSDVAYGQIHYKVFEHGVNEVEEYKKQHENSSFVYLCNGRACSNGGSYCGPDSPCFHTPKPEFAMYKGLDVSLYFIEIGEIGSEMYMEVERDAFLADCGFIKSIK